MLTFRKELKHGTKSFAQWQKSSSYVRACMVCLIPLNTTEVLFVRPEVTHVNLQWVLIVFILR